MPDDALTRESSARWLDIDVTERRYIRYIHYYKALHTLQFSVRLVNVSLHMWLMAPPSSSVAPHRNERCVFPIATHVLPIISGRR